MPCLHHLLVAVKPSVAKRFDDQVHVVKDTSCLPFATSNQALNTKVPCLQRSDCPTL